MRPSPRTFKAILFFDALFFIGLIVYWALFRKDPMGFSVFVIIPSFGLVGCLGAALKMVGERKGSARLARVGKLAFLLSFILAYIVSAVWRFVACG